MEIRLLRPEELARTEELFALAFRLPLERGREEKPDEALHWAAFDEDGEMMSTLTVPAYQMWFDGQPVRMGGIGGVSTLPQYRKRGGIRGCFEALLPELYRRGYDFSYLYPFSTAFYRKFGHRGTAGTARKLFYGNLPLGGTGAGSVRRCLRRGRPLAPHLQYERAARAGGLQLGDKARPRRWGQISLCLV